MKRQLFFIGAAFLYASCGGGDAGYFQNYTRSELRWYAYAPPLIPHVVMNKACLDCHQNGLVVSGRTAPVTPHPEWINCQQCHIRADASIPLFKANRFRGVAEPAMAVKIQPAGPPLIPHRLFMRERCLVCHNAPGRKEIVQTTHPERQNCLQCHVPQQPGVALFRRSQSGANGG